jgi:hypothetical protein
MLGPGLRLCRSSSLECGKLWSSFYKGPQLISVNVSVYREIRHRVWEYRVDCIELVDRDYIRLSPCFPLNPVGFLQWDRF